jgi:nicotinate-nucleotide adenylyltransferase
MEFFLRAENSPHRLGILPGTFNPVTIAHLALAKAALSSVDEVVFVLPRAFPHKHYTGATFRQRLDMLAAALTGQPRISVAASERGLFAEIAGECRLAYGPDVRLTFLCGRDAAQRIVSWDYGRLGAFAEMLAGFDLLVAARAGEYIPPKELAGFISSLTLQGSFDHVSATEVRQRIARGEPWEHLVPEAIGQQIRTCYSPGTPPDSPAGT